MMTFDEWCCESDIEDRWQAFHDEYGDAACLLSEYKEYHYQEYVREFQLNMFGRTSIL